MRRVLSFYWADGWRAGRQVYVAAAQRSGNSNGVPGPLLGKGGRKEKVRGVTGVSELSRLVLDSWLVFVLTSYRGVVVRTSQIVHGVAVRREFSYPNQPSVLPRSALVTFFSVAVAFSAREDGFTAQQ